MSVEFGPREQARLAHILVRLASPFENERAIAGLLATAFLARHGLTWSDLSALRCRAPAPKAPPEPSAPSEPAAPPAKRKRQRRRAGLGYWAGYCRRRHAPPQAAPRPLDVLA